MITELVLATSNPHKAAELKAMLGDLGITIRTLAEFPNMPEVMEDGATCKENAVKKATELVHRTGLPSLADDTGLMVEALAGRPGVHAARYAGEHATYEENWRKLLKELQGVQPARRLARFVTVVALVPAPGALAQVVEGILDGVIAEQPAGSYGFGYDPVFLVPDLGKTLAQLTPMEKNRISHRARALAKAREMLMLKTT